MKSLLLFLLLLPVFVSGQVIETIAGNGVAGYSGDGGAAISAELNRPTNIKLNGGNIYIADFFNNVIRKINSEGIITTIVGDGYGAGTLTTGGYSGDGGPATDAELNAPADMAFDASGQMYFDDNGNAVIRKVSTSGIITTIAGGGTSGLGDGGQATAAQLNDPFGLIFDHSGNLYFSDAGNRRVRKINTSGIITTIAGTGMPGYSGDNGPATAAELRIPCWLGIDASDNIYIPDWVSHCVRKVNSAGIITTIAGNGMAGNTGDGGLATAAAINSPCAVVFDNFGNLYISSYDNCLIRKISPSGIITTVVGKDTCGYNGDGILATSAQINQQAICSAIDPYGNLYIADSYNNRIRRIVYDETEVNTVNKTPNNISIYPNPAHNEVTIKSTTAIESVEVVNMMGQVVASSLGKGSGQAASSKEVLLDIRSQPAGVYFVKVSGPDGYRDGGRFLKEQGGY